MERPGMEIPVVDASSLEFEKAVGYNPRRVRTWIQWVTPEIAEGWLAGSTTKNRNERQRVVDTYARDMANGDFTFTGVPIIFDDGWNIIDGHHRLKALALLKGQEGVGIFVCIVWGLSVKEVQPRLDGHAARSYGDKLALAHRVEYAHSAASIAILLWQYGRPDNSPGWANPSFDEVHRTFKQHRADIDWVNVAIGGRIDPGISSGGAPVLAAFAFAHKASPRNVEKLALAYRTGEFAGDTEHSMRRLRSYVLSLQDTTGKRQRTRRWEITLIALSCIEQELAGSRQKRLVKPDPEVIKRIAAMRK